ncbi:MAG: hydroxyacylglutathione hydrolase [Burkholderiales bacterium]|nr:hydroxyacylglutathione hydrolase [Burkholderiales bacterium]
MSRWSLLPIPAFSDNYIWLLHDGKTALAVDPGDAAPLEAALAAHGLELRAILVTHHHPDHVGGLAALRRQWPGLRVIGPAREDIHELSERVRGGQHLQVLGEQIRVLDVPGHTAGHVAYVIDPPRDGSAPLLFCGDTLFAAGCGRLFEGTPAQMQASLAQLVALAPETRVCCTHEYTLANLRFALAVEPANPRLQERQRREQARRDADEPTLPSSIALELDTNPFLRCTEPAVQAAARERAPQPALSSDPLAVFTALRQWKNQF